MTVIAQWINPEETTMEICIDGVTSYVVKTVEGEYQLPDTSDPDKFNEWLKAGNQPLPYYGGK